MKKQIVITGVSQGMGQIMARKFATLGHHVIGCSRNKVALDQLQEELGTAVHLTAVDVTNETNVKEWSEVVLAKFGTPDLLINSAGIVHPMSPLWTIESKTFDSVIDTNIKGVANVIRYFVPPMVKQQRGVIINFSSGWGRYAAANAAPYCASKWAIEGMTKALALELPNGMAAVTLWPGTVNTQSLEIIYGKEKAAQFTSPQQWSNIAIPFILHIGAKDNGRPMTIPSGS